MATSLKGWLAKAKEAPSLYDISSPRVSSSVSCSLEQIQYIWIVEAMQKVELFSGSFRNFTEACRTERESPAIMLATTTLTAEES